MNKQRLFIAIAAGVGIAACFMPWISLPIFGNLNGIEGDGWIYIFLFAVVIVLAFLGNTSDLLGLKSRIATAIIGAVVTGMNLYMMIGINGRLNNLKSSHDADELANFVASTIKFKFGLYLLLLASIVLIVCSLLSSSFESEY